LLPKTPKPHIIINQMFPLSNSSSQSSGLG